MKYNFKKNNEKIATNLVKFKLKPENIKIKPDCKCL